MTSVRARSARGLSGTISESRSSSFATLASASKTWACLAMEADGAQVFHSMLFVELLHGGGGEEVAEAAPPLRHGRATSSNSNALYSAAQAVNLYAAG